MKNAADSFGQIEKNPKKQKSSGQKIFTEGFYRILKDSNGF